MTHSKWNTILIDLSVNALCPPLKLNACNCLGRFYFWKNHLRTQVTMTTAARPTFEPARGGSGKGENDLSAISKQYSARDLPSHTKIKYRWIQLFLLPPAWADIWDVSSFVSPRQEGQNAAHELRGRDFRKDLEERERAVRDKRSDRSRGTNGAFTWTFSFASMLIPSWIIFVTESGSSSSKRPRMDQIAAASLDADDPVDDVSLKIWPMTLMIHLTNVSAGIHNIELP